MEEENNYSAFPSTTTTLAFGGRGSSSSNNNNVCYNMPEEADHSHYLNFAAAAASNHTIPQHASTTIPSWPCCQRTPQIYVHFLAENGASQVQKEMLPYSNSTGSSGFTTPEASFDMTGYKRPHTEGVPPSNLSVLGYQIPSQNSYESYGPAATDSPSTVPSSISRQKAATADRRRRLRISEGVEALQQLLPHSREGGKASVLDDIIDHIKYLQFQVKELSQSRLGGESSSTPFILLEGHGHFLLHDQMQNEPLEEMMGKLLEVNPLAATQLLESRGLIVMPMSLAEGLRPQN
uniref:BHLH transcription factor bHLH32.1 n=1 Tax=Gardenia jasminoides TaxID=114476 RepID=A0A6M4C8Y4_GARJA|nr:bHLH transcription factor bHLH32.1 [Gardenia jasminoides]